jgi:hypothetical protein
MPDPSTFVFSSWNQPFAPADRRNAEELTANAEQEYKHGDHSDAEPGMATIRRTFLKSWRDVDRITRPVSVHRSPVARMYLWTDSSGLYLRLFSCVVVCMLIIPAVHISSFLALSCLSIEEIAKANAKQGPTTSRCPNRDNPPDFDVHLCFLLSALYASLVAIPSTLLLF